MRDRVLTDAEFDRLSWHDNVIYGMAFETADPEANDWTSDLVLDIDHIVEWLCGVDQRVRFRVAPATLVFHGVTDFSAAIEWPTGGRQVGLQLPSIERIARARVTDHKVYLDRSYWNWRIGLNAPQGARIAFGAVGFTQTLQAEPILQDEQWLAPAKRRALLRR